MAGDGPYLIHGGWQAMILAKVERLFGTVNAELLPDLPRHLVGATAATAPRLSLAELDRAVGAFIAGTYNTRVHSETDEAPLEAWLGAGIPAAFARQPGRTRPASSHARQAACRAARRHPFRRPALHQSYPRVPCPRTRHHSLPPARPVRKSQCSTAASSIAVW